MRDLAMIFIHLLVTIARLLGPGGTRSVIAESLLVKHQLLIVNRSRARAPVLRPTDRVIVGPCAIFMRPARLLRSAIVLKPATILRFHRSMVNRKYSLLFTPKTRGKPGPTGPSPELIAAIVEMKRRNPNFGYQRIADQISLVFDIGIEKDVVRRVLAKHYRPEPGSNGPSVCRMFNGIVSGSGAPRYLSSDNNPLFLFHRWNANLRILDVIEVKTMPYVPLSHPFVERLIGTVRREYLDQVPFWSARDLQRKLMLSHDY
jgi:putative transposase